MDRKYLEEIYMTLPKDSYFFGVKQLYVMETGIEKRALLDDGMRAHTQAKLCLLFGLLE